MEGKVEVNPANQQPSSIVVVSKKIQINSIEHELAKELVESKEHID
jgi:ribosomal 50S subunit-recycling heat shock protein